MKKLYYIAALAAIGLASCTSEEEVNITASKQEISLNAVAGKSSRAALEKTTFPEGSVIYVASAYQSTSSVNYVNHFDDNETVEFTRSKGTFNSDEDHKYYYPSGGRLGFVGYYTGAKGNDFVEPNNIGSIIERNGTKNHFSKLTLDYTGTNKLAGKTDVLYGNGSTTQFSGTTNLVFKHALAWVTVGVNETSGSVRITDIYLKNVYLTGKMTVDITDDHEFTNLNWDTTGMTTASPHFGNFVSAEGIDPSTSGNDAIGVLLPVQPQTTLVLKYFVADDATKKIVEKEIPLTTDPTIKWEAGQHYTYILNFNVNEISFTCEITPFGNNPINQPAK